MMKQITVSQEQRDVIKEISRQLYEIGGAERASLILAQLVSRWDRANEQKKFKRGGGK